jgi:hypothetical protein
MSADAIEDFVLDEVDFDLLRCRCRRPVGA